MQEVSFTSVLRPVQLKEFSSITSRFGPKNFVGYPWTIDQSVKAKTVYTTDICDCTGCLLTDGQDALLMHLCPTIERNHAFNQVVNFLRNNIDLKNPNLQAVLIGSKPNKKSLDIYNKFKQLLSQLSIPTSELKNAKAPVNIAYRTDTDEVLITNKTIDTLLRKGKNQEDVLHSSFENFEISSCDEIFG